MIINNIDHQCDIWFISAPYDGFKRLIKLENSSMISKTQVIIITFMKLTYTLATLHFFTIFFTFSRSPLITFFEHFKEVKSSSIICKTHISFIAFMKLTYIIDIFPSFFIDDQYYWSSISIDHQCEITHWSSIIIDHQQYLKLKLENTLRLLTAMSKKK